MTRRLTPSRLAFLAKATNDTTWVYSAFPDVTGHALNPADVDALVELGLITLDDGIPGQGGQHVNVTDAGFLAVKEHLDAQGQEAADDWNATYPIGTPVLAWPWIREDEPMVTRTRTPAWTLGHGGPVVSVEGYAGGIALTHVDVVPDLCRAVSEHGDVCVRPEEHPGMCQSVGRKRVSSPGQAGKPWRWYRDAAAPESNEGDPR